MSLHSAGFFPVKLYISLAGIRFIQTHHQLEQRTFSTAGRLGNYGICAFFDFKIPTGYRWCRVSLWLNHREIFIFCHPFEGFALGADMKNKYVPEQFFSVCFDIFPVFPSRFSVKKCRAYMLHQWFDDPFCHLFGCKSHQNSCRYGSFPDTEQHSFSK